MVSTIVPVYNRAVLLREAVESVIGQRYRPIEVIIVDDGSTDDTAERAEQLAAAHPEISVVHQPNRGPGPAREAGRERAQGEFIQYLDSDDVLLPGKFEAQVAGLRARPDCAVSYGYTRHRKADGLLIESRWKSGGGVVETIFPSFLRERWWDTLTPLYRAEVCDDVGPWTDLIANEDWEYDCRIGATGARLHCHHAYVAEVRDHGAGRLSRCGLSPAVLRARARAHELILGHARRARVPGDAPELEHFGRRCFLLARQCGVAGLAVESERLFAVASDALGPRMRLRLYRAAARTLGWAAAGQLAARLDGLRDAVRSLSTRPLSPRPDDLPSPSPDATQRR